MVLLIQHKSASYWGFPKGHAEVFELPIAVARRELKEETNLEIVQFLSKTFLEERYTYTFRGKQIDKTVWYYVAEVEGKLQIQQEEVSSAKWVPLVEAENHLTYETDKRVLTQTKIVLGMRSI